MGTHHLDIPTTSSLTEGTWDQAYPPLPKKDLVPVIATPPPVHRMKDTCENITFPQLLLRAVIKYDKTKQINEELNAIIRASSNRNGQKNRKIGICAPKK